MKGISTLHLLFSFFLSSSFLCPSLWASTGRVGDSISYASAPQSGLDMRIEMEYTSYAGLEMIRATRTWIMGNLVADITESIAPEDIMTMENAGLMVAMCPQIGGVYEYLDLPVGRTLTCKINASAVSAAIYDKYQDIFSEAGTIWLGPFPVSGIAQMDIGGTIVAVVNYHWN